jgi:hypothetical protein
MGYDKFHNKSGLARSRGSIVSGLIAKDGSLSMVRRRGLIQPFALIKPMAGWTQSFGRSLACLGSAFPARRECPNRESSHGRLAVILGLHD